MQKKRPNKRPASSSDSNDSSSCDEEAVEGSSMGKGGVKKLKLVKKKKAKKMEKENDLVESSQRSDSQLSEAGNNSCYAPEDKEIFINNNFFLKT